VVRGFLRRGLGRGRKGGSRVAMSSKTDVYEELSEEDYERVIGFLDRRRILERGDDEWYLGVFHLHEATIYAESEIIHEVAVTRRAYKIGIAGEDSGVRNRARNIIANQTGIDLQITRTTPLGSSE